MQGNRLTLPVGIDWSAKHAEALKTADDPVWLFDPETFRMVWANPLGLEFWRAKDLAELVERDFRGDVSSHARSEFEGHVAALAEGQVVLTRWTFFPGGAGPRNVDLLLSPVWLPGRRLGVLKRARLDRDSAQAEIARGVEALRHTDVLVTMTNLQGKLLMENPAARRSYGYTDQAPEDAVSARFASPHEARRALAQLERGAPVSREVQVQTRVGPRWHALDVHISTDPVTNGPCLIITERDISRRKEHEVALEQSRAELETVVDARTRELALERDQFEQVFDTVSALVLVVGADGIIQRANAWAHSTLHTSDLVGRPVSAACGFPNHEQLQGWIAAGRAPADAVEVQLPGPGDRTLDILWTPHVSGTIDDAFQLFLTGVDITELRGVQNRLQLTDRMATIGTLAAGLAHDLNNPLAYVTSNAEMLIDELRQLNRQEDLLGMAKDCLEGARRAANIVEQLRTFASGGASGKKGVAHVATVLDSARRLAHNHVRHHAQIDVSCPQDLYAVIDESRLGQVMLNLIVHAASNLRPGEASQHHVRIEASAGEPGWMLVVVEDDGPGLQPLELRRIFDPYASPYTPPKGMSGLGLSISQRLVDEAGGRIEVTSEANRGTRVQLWLRQVAQERTGDLGPTPPRPISSPVNPPLESEAAPSILLVDDEPKLRSVMRRALRSYRLTEAENGREALEILERESFDVVLCDIMMPELTGVELYQTLQKTRPEQAARFIFLSGGAFTADAGSFMDETTMPVLDKPFRMEHLRKVVVRALEAHTT